MFTDIGNKIKLVAMIFCLLGIAASVIAGIVMLVIFEGSLMGFAISAGVVGGGSVLSWLASLLFYGFGELIENSDLQVEELNKLRMQVNELKQPAPEVRTPAPAAAVHEQPAPAAAVRERPAPKTSAYVKPVVYDGKNWICDKCGHENLGIQTFCRDCGKHRQ